MDEKGERIKQKKENLIDTDNIWRLQEQKREGESIEDKGEINGDRR